MHLEMGWLEADQKLIPLSALQHYAFCPRQCALIHNEQAWADNYLTAKGNLLHKRVDQGEPECRNGTRFERAVSVCAENLGLIGKLDLVEEDLTTGQLTPVEYKKGKSKPGDWDKVQLCAQVMCLEEMTGQTISDGYLWYWQTRRRERVEMDEKLRNRTQEVIDAVRTLLKSKSLPKPFYEKKCQACSLIDICNPQLVASDNSADYVATIFSTEKDEP